MKKVSVYSGKGGVGKSTISVNLAAHYVDTGHRVCVIDTDKQHTLSDVYGNNLCGFDVLTQTPINHKYDILIYDHHPSHESIELQDIVICPIRPSRFDFESYRRSRAFIGDRKQVVVVNQWTNRVTDDRLFLKQMRELCIANKVQITDIKHRNIFKRMTDEAKTVFQAGSKYGASDARTEIKRIGGIIDGI